MDAVERRVFQTVCPHASVEHYPTLGFSDTPVQGVRCAACKGPAPYFWCRGNPTVSDCIRHGYCRRDPCCGD